MQYTWSRDIDHILEIGFSLEDLGIKNWALVKKDALIALDKLLATGVAVLGGDVYEMNDGFSIKSTYDNWYCNREKNEDDSGFLQRSIIKARDYINNYQDREKAKLFALVPDI